MSPFISMLEREPGGEIWLNPEVRVAYNDGLDARTLRVLTEIVQTNRERIEGAWNEFFG